MVSHALQHLHAIDKAAHGLWARGPDRDHAAGVDRHYRPDLSLDGVRAEFKQLLRTLIEISIRTLNDEWSVLVHRPRLVEGRHELECEDHLAHEPLAIDLHVLVVGERGQEYRRIFLFQCSYLP